MIDHDQIRDDVAQVIFEHCSKNVDMRATTVAAVLSDLAYRCNFSSTEQEHAVLDALHDGFRRGLWSYGATLRQPGSEWLHIASPAGAEAYAEWRRKERR